MESDGPVQGAAWCTVLWIYSEKAIGQLSGKAGSAGTGLPFFQLMNSISLWEMAKLWFHISTAVRCQAPSLPPPTPHPPLQSIETNQNVKMDVNRLWVIGSFCVWSPRISPSHARLVESKSLLFLKSIVPEIQKSRFKKKKKKREEETTRLSCLLRGYAKPLISK